MKVIDFDKMGNVVRFYLGEDDCNDYYGDDWDDTPYEHNAGTVYEEYISKYVDYAFPLDYLVREPEQDYRWRGNSPYDKYKMKNGDVPCIIVIDPWTKETSWDDGFSYWVGSKNSTKIYFNDDFFKMDKELKKNGGVQLFPPMEFVDIIYCDNLPVPCERTMGKEFRICDTRKKYISLYTYKNGVNEYYWEEVK